VNFSRRRHHHHGFVLPAVLLFLAVAFGMWAMLFRSSATVLRFEQARTLRAGRANFAAPAMATGLRLLETGVPPSDPYACKVTLELDGVTRYYRLGFEQIAPNRWTIDASPTTEDDITADAPATFAVAPDAPGGLFATAISKYEIHLAWDDVLYDNGYLVERSPNGSTGWNQIDTTAAGVTTYPDTGLTHGTTYYYRVRATNTSGTSSYSAVVSATTISGIPAAPSDLAGAVPVAKTVNLTWTDNSTVESGFRIERSSDGGSTWGNAVSVGDDVVSYSVGGLIPGQWYSFRVRAEAADGNSGWSNVVTVKPN
jgi:hypothetical protein